MRYYLHIDELDTDLEGEEFSDLAAAKREALLAAREILAGAIRQGLDDVPLRFLITDATGRLLETVHTTDVLPRVLLNGKQN